VNIVPAFIRRRIAHRPNLLKIVDNIGWLFFDKVLRLGVGLLVGVWVARYLGPEQFGLFSFAAAFIGLFGAFAGLGLQSIVVRDIVRDSAYKEETLGTAVILLLVGGFLAYGLTLGTIFWLRPDDALAKVLVAILGSMTLFKASEVVIYWFESQVQSKYTVLVQNGSFLVFACIKVALILSNATLIAFAWASMAEALLVALLMLAMFGLRGLGLLKLRASLDRAKVLLADCWPLLLSGITITIYMRIDLIMLGQMLDDEAVGIYSAATRISEVWYFLPSAITASILPTLIHAKKISKVLYHQRLQRLCTFLTWLAIAVALPMTFMADWLVIIIYGQNYIAAGNVLSIHIWAAVFVFLGIGSGIFFTIENLAKIFFYRTTLGCLLNIVLNIYLIPLYGVKGAAIATVLSQFFANYLLDVIDSSTRELLIIKTKAFFPFGLIGNKYE
jgi:O-antigen/teichoic acid export membrane protein